MSDAPSRSAGSNASSPARAVFFSATAALYCPVSASGSHPASSALCNRPIEAYTGELNQVWTNLIDNAVDAMKGSSTLRIHTLPKATRSLSRL